MRWVAIVLATLATVALAWLSLGDGDTHQSAMREGVRGPETSVERATARRETAPPALAGRVLRDGEPARAEVTLALGGREIRRARAGEEGNFAFAGLAADVYHLHAVAPDGAVGVAVASLAVKGAAVQVTIALRGPVHELSGVVVDEAGAPVRGTMSIGESARSPLFATGATDERGAFRLSGIPAGLFHVGLRVGEHLELWDGPVSVPHDGDYRFIVSLPDLYVGKVLDYETRAPVAGATIEAGTQNSSAETTSAADGSFRLAAPEGELTVRATGYAEASNCPSGGEILLHRAASVEGVVVEADGGAPVAGVEVHARSLATHGKSKAVTGPDGYFTMADLFPAEAALFVASDLWRSEGSENLSFRDQSAHSPLSLFLRPGVRERVTLRVERAGSIEGLVLDAEERPVAGAIVTYRSELAPLRAASDGDGAFRIDGVPRGRTLELAASAPGFLRTTVFGRERVVIRFDAPRLVQVKVVEATTGLPVAGAVVRELDSQDRPTGTGWLADARGLALAGPLQPGSESLHVSAEGYFEQGVPLSRGVTEAALERGAALRVRVLRPDGTPRRSASVSAHLTERYEIDRQCASGTTASDGWITLSPLRATPHSIQVWHDDAHLVTTATPGSDLVVKLPDAAPGEEYEAELCYEGRLIATVRAVDPMGRPVPGAHVLFECAGGGGTAEELIDGATELWDYEESEETSYRVTVMRAATRDGSPLPYGAVRTGPVATGGTIEVRLPPERTIEGLVVDARGRAVAGALLRAFLLDHQPGAGNAMGGTYCDVARSRADGSFRLGRLGEGRVAIWTKAPRAGAPPEPTLADPGERVTIRLPRGVDATVTVVDPAGAPVEGAIVRVRPVGDDAKATWSSEARDLTGPGGVLRLADLAPGQTFTLSITPPPERRDMTPFEEKWTAADTTVRLFPRGAIEGEVRDAAGRPLPDATVHALGQDGRERTCDSDRHGRFRLDGLGGGAATVWAEFDAPTMATRVGARQLAASGAKDLLLTVDTGPSLRLRVVGWNRGGSGDVRLNPRLVSQPYRDEASIASDGTAVVYGVDATRTYDVMVGPVGNGFLKYLRGVRAGEDEIAVELEKGGTIAGRVVSAIPWEGGRVTFENPALGHGPDTEPDGTFEIEGVPPGRWRFVANFWTPDGKALVGTAEASAGERLEIALRPAEPDRKDR